MPIPQEYIMVRKESAAGPLSVAGLDVGISGVMSVITSYVKFHFFKLYIELNKQ